MCIINMEKDIVIVNHAKLALLLYEIVPNKNSDLSQNYKTIHSTNFTISTSNIQIFQATNVDQQIKSIIIGFIIVRSNLISLISVRR